MEIVGREAELAAVAAFLDTVPEGPSALLLEGEAGIGKTTVWHEAVRLARERSFRVLSARPSESEAKLSFTALADLVEDVLDEALPALPAPQRRALDVALLRADTTGRAPDQRVISVACLGILRHLAATSPVVVAIDDLQWLDSPSARVVEFCIRRLKDEPIALVAAVRLPTLPATYLGVDRSLPSDRVGRVEIGAMSFGALQRLIRQDVGDSLSRATMRRLHEASGGNPFFALEIARALERRGAEPAPNEPLPVPEDLRGLVRDRLAALPKRTREVLLFASALSQPTVSVLERAAAMGTRTRALAAATRAGIIVVTEGRIRFAHPLLASVTYTEASEAERRRLHRRLAAVLSDPEERARHFALGAEGPDEAIASVLESAARGAWHRGATDASAELAEMASRLTPSERRSELIARRILQAESQYQIGENVRAKQQLDVLVGEMKPGPARARVLLTLAGLTGYIEGGEAADRLGTQALAEAGDDADLRGRIHLMLSGWTRGGPEQRSHHARAAFELLGGQSGDRYLAAKGLAAIAQAEMAAGNGPRLDLLERAAALEEQGEPPNIGESARWLLALGLLYSDHFQEARPRLQTIHHLAQEEGDETAVPVYQRYLAELECWSGGDLELAALHSTEALARTRELGSGLHEYYALTCLAWVDATRGRVTEARLEATSAKELGDRFDPTQSDRPLWVLGFLEISLGRYANAAQYCSEADRLWQAGPFRDPRLFAFPADLIEALVAVGELEKAEVRLKGWEDYGRTAGRRWAQATAARCRALLHAARGDLPGATESIAEALGHHESLQMPLELGRTLLVQGQIERRGKHRRVAKESFERAREIFERLPAPLWAEKARAELRRVGIRAPAPLELTATEERVAELAAAGRTNKEVAEALFLSRRTVEANLVRVYRKLGISSRAELGSSMAARRGASL